VITAQLTASGDISQYTASTRNAIAQRFASAAGVPAIDVVVSVAAASVVLTVSITVTQGEGVAALSAVSQQLADAATATAFLATVGGTSVTVLSIDAAPTLALASSLSPPPPGQTLGPDVNEQRSGGSGGSDSSVVVVAAAAGGVVLLLALLGAVWYCRAKQATGSHPVVSEWSNAPMTSVSALPFGITSTSAVELQHTVAPLTADAKTLAQPTAQPAASWPSYNQATAEPSYDQAMEGETRL
jgi:hypothetical protein